MEMMCMVAFASLVCLMTITVSW